MWRSWSAPLSTPSGVCVNLGQLQIMNADEEQQGIKLERKWPIWPNSIYYYSHCRYADEPAADSGVVTPSASSRVSQTPTISNTNSIRATTPTSHAEIHLQIVPGISDTQAFNLYYMDKIIATITSTQRLQNAIPTSGSLLNISQCFGHQDAADCVSGWMQHHSVSTRVPVCNDYV